MSLFATFQSSGTYLTNPVGYFRNSDFTEAISGSYLDSNLPYLLPQGLPVQPEIRQCHPASVQKQRPSLDLQM